MSNAYVFNTPCGEDAADTELLAIARTEGAVDITTQTDAVDVIYLTTEDLTELLALAKSCE